MRCKRARKFLPLHMDGRLAARHQQALDRHLATCAACRQEFAGLKRAVGLLRTLPDLRPPADFKRAIINGVRKADYERRTGQAARVPLFAPRWAYAAAAVALVLAGFAVGRFTQGPDTRTVAEEPPANSVVVGIPPPSVVRDPSRPPELEPITPPEPSVDVVRVRPARPASAPTARQGSGDGVGRSPGPDDSSTKPRPSPAPGGTAPLRRGPAIVANSPNHPDRMTPAGLVFTGLSAGRGEEVVAAGNIILEDTLVRQVGLAVLSKMLDDPKFAESIAGEIGTPDWRKSAEGALYAGGDPL